MSEAETTGTHAIPPPPRLPRERESDPPLTAKGASWKVIGAALGLMFAALLPSATVVMEAGAIRQALTDVRDEVNNLRTEVRGVGDREASTRERVAVIKTRVDRIEADLAELQRRSTIGPLAP